MKGRWKRLNENANKWVAEKEAHSIYEERGSKFQDIIVFNEVMSKCPKWAVPLPHDRTRSRPEDEEDYEEESGGSSKRSKTSEDVESFVPSNPNTPDTGCSNISRPEGRDKAKQKGKGKMSNANVANEFAAELRALRITRDNEMELMKNVSQAKIELERMKMKHKMLNKLLGKDHLSPEEEDLKRRLMESIFGE